MSKESFGRGSVPRFSAINEMYDRCGLKILEYMLPLVLLWLIQQSSAFLP